MSIEGQGHFFTIYFPGFVCFVLYKAKISGERLQDHWSSGFKHFDPRGLSAPSIYTCLLLFLTVTSWVPMKMLTAKKHLIISSEI